MKTIFISILTCISLFTFAQEDTIPKNGKVTLYYPAEDGIHVVKAIGMNKKNKPIEVWQFYTPNGIPDYTIEYKGVSTIRKTKLQTTVISEEHFTNDTLDGVQTYYNERKQKTVQAYYSKGRLDSVLQFYEYAKYYAPISARYIFYPDLKLKQKEEFFETGERKSIKNYDKTGQLDGLSETYDRYDINTIYLIRREEYKNGRLNGVVIAGSKNGILSECTYENGLQHGVCKTYYDYPKLQYFVEYVHGIKTGQAMRYSGSGVILSKEYWSGVAGKYSKDVYDSCFVYRQDGSIHTKKYNRQLNDYQIEERQVSFFPNGKVKEEFARVDSEYNGIYKIYNEDGLLQREVPYKLGVIDGKMTFWHANGKKQIELIVKNDTVFSQKVWSELGKIVTNKSAWYKDLIVPATWYEQLVNLDEGYETLTENIYDTPPVVAMNTDIDYQAEVSNTTTSKNPKYYDKNAEFAGGWLKLNEFIDSVKRKPELLKTFNTSVNVNVEYTVQSDGTASIVKINCYFMGNHSFVTQLLEMEVRRIFSLLSFRPAVLNGKNITSSLQAIVIKF